MRCGPILMPALGLFPFSLLTSTDTKYLSQGEVLGGVGGVLLDGLSPAHGVQWKGTEELGL